MTASGPATPRLSDEGARSVDPSPLLSYRGATLGYRRRAVLTGVDLDVSRGDFLGIVGPNGSGKSTLLAAALGLRGPSSGKVWRAPGLRIGYVPQRSRIDPIFPLRVRDLIMMGRYPHVGVLRRPRESDRVAVVRAAQALSIEELLERPFRDLSGGQQQRALIARALAVEPHLLVLDEPTNGMDLGSERAIVEVIAALHRERGVTVLFVTHLLNLLANYADRFALIQDGCVRVGAREALLTAEVLSDLYDTPVLVENVGGRRLILAAGPHDERAGDAGLRPRA